jgi:hypothetical protein
MYKLYNFGIREQFATRKSIISIYRATSIFDLHMRIFNLQDLGAPEKPKKKLSAKNLILHLTTAFLGKGKFKKSI